MLYRADPACKTCIDDLLSVEGKASHRPSRAQPEQMHIDQVSDRHIGKRKHPECEDQGTASESARGQEALSGGEQ